MFLTQTVSANQGAILAKLVSIQETSFAENFTTDIKYNLVEMRDFAGCEDNIVIVLLEEGEPCSFVMSEPYATAYKELSGKDKDLVEPDGWDAGYYVSTIVVHPLRRKKMDYFILVRALVEELVRNRDIRDLFMHAKVSNGYSKRILRFCENSQCLRTVDDWLGSGEQFDFITMHISDEDIENFDRLLSRRKR